MNILSIIRESIIFKYIAALVAINFIVSTVLPTNGFALTSGPSQPEVQSFEPAGTTEMVDLFSGDFTYNIPLLELPGPNGGYPFNISYHSGIGMDQEASWVGLGWNLNPGVINRTMRGIPDDFDGDIIKRTNHIKKDYTYGVSFGGDFEVFGGKIKKPAKASISLGMRFYYNNYKGVGYNLSTTFGYSAPASPESSGIGANAGLSLGSQDGVGATASVNFTPPGSEERNRTLTFGQGIGFNSKRGLSQSMSMSMTRQISKVNDDKSVSTRTSGRIGGTSSISYSEPGFVPAVSLPMKSTSLDVEINTGAAIFGAFGNFSVGGFYSESELKNNGSEQSYPAYGYNHLQNASESNALMDFNRTKDPIVRPATPNLATTQLNNDVYSVMGQGVGGMFRPYRSEVGHVHDPEVESTSSGGAFGFDLGLPGHFGGNFTYNSGNSKSGPWKDDNPWYNTYKFRGAEVSSAPDYEPVYFKAHGEYTSFDNDELDYIGGEEPVRALLTKSGSHYKPVSNILHKNGKNIATGGTVGAYRNESVNESNRMPRNQAIMPVTNNEIGGSTPILGEYDVKLSGGTSVDRSISDHIGGITSINAEGVRYVFGLPAMNRSNNEFVFSVNQESPEDCKDTVQVHSGLESGKYKVKGTNEFYSKTDIPDYAYSYLLTSVLGTDYIDSDDTLGVSVGDEGYWVKFTYKEISDGYRWKAPYHGANYLKGFESTNEDDKGAFSEGTKEVYYLAKAESKTHMVKFFTSARQDGFEANSSRNSGIGSTSFHKLDSMQLFSRGSSGNKLLQTVVFNYDYSLCPNVLNNSVSGGGKLTLKSLKFKYQNNSRGSLTPYEFTYGDSDHNGSTDFNPSYGLNNYDRWGNYKPDGAYSCENKEYSYVEQFNSNTFQNDAAKASYRDSVDMYAAAWNLTDIKLPTGGKIEVDYESDDYAYVQDKQPLQMFRIRQADGFHSKTQSSWKLYFDLEHPIATDGGYPNIKTMLKEQYIEPLKVGSKYQLYYNTRIHLRDGRYEFIAGYSNIDTDTSKYGVDKNSIESGHFTRGFITLQKSYVNGDVDYHPIRAAAWQHMRTDQPDLLNAPGKLEGKPGSSKASKAAKIKSLISVVSEVKKVFKGYRKYAYDRGFAGSMDLTRSYMRLGNPDNMKYGGGCRVKKIAISDEWSDFTNQAESSATYGQEYDYTMEEDGKLISSGIAQNEPMIGADENPYRFAKEYPQSNTIFTGNSLFYEYPINEAYFPGASVGYRKVTVRSLATGKVLNNTIDEHAATTGIVEHRFYTAKEYPIIVDETDMSSKPYNLSIPIPLIGMIETNNLTASQGYSIILNDMHGKPKSVEYFGMDKYGQVEEESNSKVEYYYRDKPKVRDDGSVARQLDNNVEVFVSEYDNTSAAETENRTMGVEYEFFMDMRHSRNTSTVGGLSINTDWVIFAVIPVPWPNITRTTADLRTVSTNKIIHKAGILDSTVATDGESVVATKNLLYDALTGKAVLTSVKNNYEDEVFKMEYPAHLYYDGMGAAYKNIGLVYKAEANQLSNSTSRYGLSKVKDHNGNSVSVETISEILSEGDEMIITHIAGTAYNDYKATLVKNAKCSGGDGSLIMHTETSEGLIDGNELTFKIVRSGRRNLITQPASDVLALSNPTENISAETSSGSVNVVTDDLVDFWNYVLDCHGTGKLPTTEYFMDDPQFKNADGSHRFPEVNAIFDKFQFGIMTPCVINQEGTMMATPDGTLSGSTHDSYSSLYFFRYTLKDECGSSVCHDCDGFLANYDPSPGFPHVYQDATISYFQKISSTTIRAHYSINGYSVDLDVGGCVGSTISTTPKNLHVQNVLNASASRFDDFWRNEYINDNSCDAYTATIEDPYLTGEKGIYRVKETFYYDDERFQSSSDVDLSDDGVYANEGGTSKRFYLFTHNATLDRPLHERWVSNQIITRYNEQGFEVENSDILGIYSAARYGYGKTLPTAVASETKYFELYTENADDPTNAPQTTSGAATLSSSIAHTGQKSIKVLKSGSDATLKTSIRPVDGATYYVSAWVRVENENVAKYTSYNVEVSAKFYDEGWTNPSSEVGGITLVGGVIEGWQKMEGEITVPSGYDGQQMALVLPKNSSKDVYYDDIRVIPSNGNVKTYVYDPDSYRLSAVLDENNFASLYFYDESGQLYLVKKETEDGVLTIQESRNHLAQ